MFEVLVLIIFNIVIYYRTIFYDRVMDDIQWAEQKKNGLFPIKNIRNINNLRHVIDERLYGGTTFGLNTKIEHSFTIFLHIIICILIYLTLDHNQISFWAAMLYSCHPINNQTAIWLNGRRYAINIILSLLMMIFPFASPFLYIFTGTLQVTAFFSPILLSSQSYWYLALMPLFLIIGYKFIKSRISGRKLSEGDLKTFKISRLIVIIKTFGFFFFKMIIPQVCCMQYPDRFYWGLTQKGNEDAYKLDKDFYKGIVAFLIILGVYCLIPSHFRFYLAFFVLATLQWSAIFPITQILSDRYMSLPNVFMMFFLSYLASFTGMIYIPLMIILCIYYLLCLFIVMPMYQNIISFYEYNINIHPNIPWPRTFLINYLMNSSQHEKAGAYVFEGLKNNQTDHSLLMWGAIISLTKGRLGHAEAFLKEAEKNFYIGQEERQKKEISKFREDIHKIKGY